MFSVDNVLTHSPSNSDDYYQILRCSETSTTEQILTEYKIRALKCHPDKNAGNEFALAEFQKLQEARDTLTDPEKKSKYDYWRKSGMCMSYKQWLSLSSRGQMTMHWSTPRTGLMLDQIQTVESSNNTDDNNITHSDSHAKEDYNPLITEIKVTKPWRSEHTSGIYGKFRNYQI